MDLKLTSKIDQASDNIKLLYFIYRELVQIREALSPAVLGEVEQGNTIAQEEQKSVATGALVASNAKEGFACKYCGEFIEGNRGKLLAHIRKCPKRT